LGHSVYIVLLSECHISAATDNPLIAANCNMVLVHVPTILSYLPCAHCCQGFFQVTTVPVGEETERISLTVDVVIVIVALLYATILINLFTCLLTGVAFTDG